MYLRSACTVYGNACDFLLFKNFSGSDEKKLTMQTRCTIRKKDQKTIFLFSPEASAAACSPSEIDYSQFGSSATLKSTTTTTTTPSKTFKTEVCLFLVFKLLKSNDKSEASGEVKCMSTTCNFLEALALGLTRRRQQN